MLDTHSYASRLQVHNVVVVVGFFFRNVNMAVLLDFFQLAHVRATSRCNLYRVEICSTVLSLLWNLSYSLSFMFTFINISPYNRHHSYNAHSTHSFHKTKMGFFFVKAGVLKNNIKTEKHTNAWIFSKH